MKNKGFTLVELLAVIAILAVLVIIALPNVMGMFKNAKKNSFTTEAKEIIKTVEQTWIMDSLYSTGEVIYSKCESGCTNPLDLSGRDNIDYYVRVDKSGKVVEFYITDGTYQYTYNGNGTGINFTDIGDVSEVSSLPDNQILSINNGTPTINNSPINNNPSTPNVTQVVPNCELRLNFLTITLDHSNSTSFGLVYGNSTPTYNGVDSMEYTNNGTYYGYVKSETNYEKVCSIEFMSSCPAVNDGTYYSANYTGIGQFCYRILNDSNEN